MAFQNPSNLYSGGQVLLDSTPYLNIALKQKAKEQAASDAMNKYFEDTIGKIDPSVAREQDREYIVQRIGDIYNNWQTNKDAIKRGGNAAVEFGKLINVVRGEIALSKSEGVKPLNIAKAQREGKYTPRKADIDILANIEKPINDNTRWKDPTRRLGYDERDLDGFALQFDANKKNQFKKSVFGNIAPVADLTTLREDGKGNIFIKQKIEPEAFKTIANNAAIGVRADKSARIAYEDALGDANFLEQATKAYQSVFGGNETIKTAEQAAAADMIMNAMATQKEIKVDDEALKQKYKLELEKVKNANKVALSDRKSAQADKRTEMLMGGSTDTDAVAWDKTGSITPVKLQIKAKFGLPYAVDVARIEDGTVYETNGSVMQSGELEINSKELPMDAINGLTSFKDVYVPNKTKIRVKDGKIVALLTNKGWADRNSMRNGQLNLDKEPQKGKKMDFSSGNNSTPTQQAKPSGAKKLKW